MRTRMKSLAWLIPIFFAACGDGATETQKHERADTAPPPICTDQGIAGDVCNGPWSYQLNNLCYAYAPNIDCPGSYHDYSCTRYTTCSNPAFGVAYYHDVDGTVVSGGATEVSCQQPNPGRPPVCTKYCDFSQSDPAADATAAYGGTSATVYNCWPTSGAPRCKETCNVTVHNVPVYNSRAAYPCPTEHYDCPHLESCRTASNGYDTNPTACGQTQQLSAGGLTLAQLTASLPSHQGFYGTPSCTTCETLPLATAADVEAKYACLSGALANASIRARVVRNLKQLLELHADALTPLERVNIIALYASDPTSEELACGPDWQPPATDASCDVSNINATLAMCNRLLLPHASRDAIVALLPNCVAIKTSIDALPDTCSKSDYQAAQRSVTMALGSKVVSTPTAHTGIPTQAQLQARLYALGIWYDANVATGYPPGVDRTQLYQDTSDLVGAFWEDLRQAALARIETADQPDAAPITATDLDDARTRAMDVDRQVALAAFTIYGTTGKTPLSNGALLFVTADALQGIGERAQDLSVFHDAACQFRSAPCATTPSKLSSMFGILSALDDATALQGAINAATPMSTDAWRPIFTAIHDRHDALEAAVEDVTGTTTYDPTLLSAPSIKAQSIPPLASLSKLIGAARTATQSYKTRGLFDPSRGKRLISGMAKTTLDAQRGDFTTKAGNLDAAVLRYQNNLSTLVQQLVAQIHNQGDQATADARVQEQREKLTQLTNEEVALQTAAGHDSARFGELDAAFQVVAQSAGSDGGMQMQRHSEAFDVPASEARFIKGTNRSTISFKTVAARTGGAQPWTLHVEPGDQLHITVSDVWAPTCAMQDFQRDWPNVVIHGSDSTIYPLNHIDYDGVFTGPEGWSLQIQSGTIKAVDNSTGWSIANTTTNSDSFNYCEGLSGAINGGGGAVSISASAAANWCWGTTHSETDTESYGTTLHDGSEVRGIESLASGLHLRNTPFPRLPAGALLLVEMNANQDTFLEMNAVHVLQHQSAIVVAKSSDLYLVVNDLQDTAYCQILPDPIHPGLHVELVKTTPLDSLITKVQLGMADALKQLRDSTQQYVDQGQLLPNDAKHLADIAAAALRARCACSASELPAVMGDLFSEFVTQEVVNIERQARLATVRNGERVATLELQALANDLGRAQGEGRLQKLLPTWTLRNLDEESLRFDAHALAQVISDEIYPMSHLRYPAAIGQIGTDASTTIESLRTADWTTPTAQVAGAARTLADRISSDLATTIANSTPLHTTLVALRFPKPGTTPSSAPMHMADSARAHEVWDALGTSNLLQFTIRPEDLYDASGGSFTLGCTESTPVVQWMGIYTVLTGAPAGTDAVLNGWHYRPRLLVEEPLVFATPAQAELYGMGAEWRNGNVHLSFGNITNVGTMTLYADAQAELNGNGLSPFGTFHVDVSDLMPPRNSAGSPFTYASELVVVLQVESVNVAPPGPTWTGICPAQ